MDSVFAEPWLEFVNELGEVPRLQGPLEDTLTGWDRLAGKLFSKYGLPPKDETVATEDFHVWDCWVRTFTPKKPSFAKRAVPEPLPLGIYFHGGGFVMGGVDQEDAFCRALARHCNIKLVSVEYRLSPAFKFPIPLEDCVSATTWALSHFCSETVTLIGTSAGGNLAFATALKLIEKGKGDCIRGVVALAPITVHPDAVPTSKRELYTAYDENADNTINTKSAMKCWLEAYGAPADSLYLSCLLHPQLEKLKKVCVTACGVDTLRDDARLMKSALEEAQVPVRYTEYAGYPHCSWLFPAKCLAEHQQTFFGNLSKDLDWIHN